MLDRENQISFSSAKTRGCRGHEQNIELPENAKVNVAIRRKEGLYSIARRPCLPHLLDWRINHNLQFYCPIHIRRCLRYFSLIREGRRTSRQWLLNEC